MHRPHRLAVALALAWSAAPLPAQQQNVSTKRILKDILKEFAKVKAEELIGKALGRDAGQIVRAAYEIKQAKGNAKKEVRQAFLEALLGPGTIPSATGAPANSAMVSSFQKILGTAPREDGAPPRRGLFRDPAVAQLAGFVVAYSSAKGADKKAVKEQLIDALIPHVTKALGRSRSQTLRGMADILGSVHELRRGALAPTTPENPGPVEATGDALPENPVPADPAPAEPAPDPATEAPSEPAPPPGEIDGMIQSGADDQAMIDKAVARAMEAQRAEQGGPLTEAQIRAIVLRTFVEAKRMSGN